MRTNPALAKRALSKRMQIKDEKELEDTYQLLKSFVQVKPYPSLGGFQDDLRRSGEASAGGKNRQREGICGYPVH